MTPSSRIGIWGLSRLTPTTKAMEAEVLGVPNWFMSRSPRITSTNFTNPAMQPDFRASRSENAHSSHRTLRLCVPSMVFPTITKRPIDLHNFG